jgi:hypothetical protein
MNLSITFPTQRKTLFPAGPHRDKLQAGLGKGIHAGIGPAATGEYQMRKTLIALAAAATIAGGMIAAPGTADARCNGCGIGAGVAAGILGGAIIGGAIANSAPAYGPAYVAQPGYVAYPGYSRGYPVACPGGYWARRPVFDRFGNQVGYSRPRFFCP